MFACENTNHTIQNHTAKITHQRYTHDPPKHVTVVIDAVALEIPNQLVQAVGYLVGDEHAACICFALFWVDRIKIEIQVRHKYNIL